MKLIGGLVLGAGVIGVGSGVPALLKENAGFTFRISEEMADGMCLNAKSKEQCEVEWIGSDLASDEEIVKENEDWLRSLGVQDSKNRLAKLLFVKKGVESGEGGVSKNAENGHYIIRWGWINGRELPLGEFQSKLEETFRNQCNKLQVANRDECGAGFWFINFENRIETPLIELNSKLEIPNFKDVKELENKYQAALVAIKEVFDGVGVPKKK